MDPPTGVEYVVHTLVSDPPRKLANLPMSAFRDRRSAGHPASAPAAALLAVAAFITLACGTAEFELPNPRRLVILSGERLAPTKARMEEVDAWIRPQMDSIELDPSFMIYTNAQEGPVYPWERLDVNEQGDTASISAQGRPGVFGPYTLYAHFHLMKAQNRLDQWLPEAAGGTDFEIERAILARVADAWLYQRAIFDAAPYGILDELTYAKENGFLEEFILIARPDAFVEARREWLAENPEGRDAYLAWFQSAFERDPPGLRGG